MSRGKILPEVREELRHQVYSAALKGWRVKEIGEIFDLSADQVDDLLAEARRERSKSHKREVEEEYGSLVYMIDHISLIRRKMFKSLENLEKKNDTKSQNLSAIYNGLIHLAELESKVKGLVTNRVSGPDGKGPIEIMAVTDREKAIEEITNLLLQEQEMQGLLIDKEDQYDTED